MSDNPIQDKPYFCPNCRSNRVKFNVVTMYSQSFMKDAMTGMISGTDEAMQVSEPEPNIQCRVCGFTGNELRFIKQAEREPRHSTLPGQGLQ
jgi:predicted Zn-ribbon and HTH transcriptional regulator